MAAFSSCPLHPEALGSVWVLDHVGLSRSRCCVSLAVLCSQFQPGGTKGSVSAEAVSCWMPTGEGEVPWCCASPGCAAEPAAPPRASNSSQEAGRTLLGPGCLLLAGLEAALKNRMALERCRVGVPPAGLPGQHPSGVGTKPPARLGPELWSVLTGCFGCEAVVGGNEAEISPVAAGEVASEAGQPQLQRPLARSCSEHPSVTSWQGAGVLGTASFPTTNPTCLHQQRASSPVVTVFC